MRLFTAVDISERSRELIERKVNILKENLDENLKWVEKENWHVTLNFLGDCEEEKKDEVIQSLKSLELATDLDYIQFNELNAFPSLENPKVLYLGVKRGNDYLKNLNQLLEIELKKLGFEEEKREFTPHLTLARNKNHAELDFEADFLKNSFINIFSYLDSLTLYESRLKENGPEYIELFSKKLK